MLLFINKRYIFTFILASIISYLLGERPPWSRLEHNSILLAPLLYISNAFSIEPTHASKIN